MGEALMRWTVRLAVACVVLRAFVRLRRNDRASTPPSSLECWLWGIGCVSYLVHVALAFEVVHDWSHDRAWRHTAEQTARLTGISRGDGIWVNHGFTLLWLWDVLRLLVARARQRSTSRTVDRIVAAIFAFIVFNATVVFGPDVYRWLLIPTIVLLGYAWNRSRSST